MIPDMDQYKVYLIHQELSDILDNTEKASHYTSDKKVDYVPLTYPIHSINHTLRTTAKLESSLVTNHTTQELGIWNMLLPDVLLPPATLL